MFFKIKAQKSSYEDAIHFLNSDAKSFYSSNHKFIDKDYETFFKSSLLTALVDLDRVIRGTFNCDIFLKNADLGSLKTMFPNAINNIFNIKTDEDIKKLGHLLEILRNINAHALLCDADFEFFKFDFSSLLEQKKMNSDICYFGNKGITVAGVIFILLNFVREETIYNLTNCDYIFGLVSCGRYERDKGADFVNRISKVNLENPIRKNTSDNILGAITGELPFELKDDSGDFLVKVGARNNPTFLVSGSLKENVLTINSESLSKTYYEKDYVLKITDKEGFIELSNSLPPFVLVDYLKETKVKVFDRKVYERTAKFDLLNKLNKPKFYTDKNLNVILLPKSISDFRMMSSLFVDSLMRIFLLLENYIYRTRKITRDNFSSIGIAMKEIGVPEELITNAKYIRNFVAHGYILNEYMIYKDCRVQFTTKYFIKTLRGLLDYFESHEEDIYQHLSLTIKKYLLDKTLSAKYKKVCMASRTALEYYPHHDKNDLSIKNGFVNNSFFNVEDFNVLVSPDPVLQPSNIVRIEMSDCNDCLYLNDNDSDLRTIENFANQNFYKIENVIDKGLIKYFYLKKIH